ncbi:MAG: phosphatidylglycerophosphatase A family protein [bacterium]
MARWKLGKFKRGLAGFIATGAFVGYLPLMPGTFGSALGLGIYLLAARTPWLFYSIAACSILVGAWASGEAEIDFGRRDDPRIVIDEVAGMLVTFFLLSPSIYTAGFGFALFRILDILKPFPIGRLQGVRGGWGVMLDDIAAGAVGNLLLRLGIWVKGGMVFGH